MKNEMMRGVEILLPSPDQITELYRFLDIAAHYGANALMIDLGDAMEYKRHPEINESRLEHATTMDGTSGKEQEPAGKAPWRCDSIRATPGGERAFPQDLLRSIADHARKLGMEIIPEVSCPGHAADLPTRPRDLAERTGGPRPDTDCPSNPKSHGLLFDVLEETIELFHPRVVNVGHGELHSIDHGHKGKTVPELYADDIREIHDFLAGHGVKTMIQTEKLLAPRDGAEAKDQPATHPAIDLIPRDLLLLHRHWSLDRHYEREFEKRGFRFAFGDFSSRSIPAWKSRSAADGFFGWLISNQGRLDLPGLQRNGVLADLAFAAFLDQTDDSDGNREMLRERAFRSLFELRYGDGKSRFYILHSTAFSKPYRPFTDRRRINGKEDELGAYVITLKDGRQFKTPVVYGFNVSSSRQNWNPPRPSGNDIHDGLDPLAEVAYTTLPVRNGERTAFLFGIWIPEGSEVMSCVYRPFAGHEEEKIDYRFIGTFREPPAGEGLLP